VLPTQLESEDSDSECEGYSNDDTRRDVDCKSLAYDEDVDNVDSQDTLRVNKVENDVKPEWVSKHYAIALFFYLFHD
jgi:hypothetical protein